MKRLAAILASLMIFALSASAVDRAPLANETLRYKLSYKWGLVQKNAGSATITLRVNGDRCSATLTGRTDPWADKFYKVRDTLRTTFSAKTMLPTRYERIAHEGGDYYAHDVVSFGRSGANVTAKTVAKRRTKKHPQLRTESYSLSGTGRSVDMLSVLYYLRSMNFDRMVRGQSENLTIFSGKKKENLRITYHGRERIKINGKHYDSYRVFFTFTSDGKKKSSDPIDAWISADASRIPLKIEGSLKIGKVRCIYAG